MPSNNIDARMLIPSKELDTMETTQENKLIKAMNAPEKTKLLALSKTIRAIELPSVSTDDAKLILQQTEHLIKNLCNFIEEKSETL